MHGFVKRAGMAAAVLVVGLGALAACGGGGNDAVKDAIDKATNGKVKVDRNGNQITVKDKNGGGSFSVGSGTDLPKGFPKSDVPLPEGGKLQAAVSSEQNGREGYSLTYAYDNRDDVNQAVDDYKSALEEAGYNIEGNSSVSGGNASFTTFMASGTDWDVTAYAGRDTGGSSKSGVMQVTVVAHENDTTDTTD